MHRCDHRIVLEVLWHLPSGRSGQRSDYFTEKRPRLVILFYYWVPDLATSARNSTTREAAVRSRSRGADRPRFAGNFPPSENRGRRENRVHAAPAVPCANSHSKCRTRAYRFGGGSRPSLRNGFTAYNVPSLVNGFLATIASRVVPQDLTPAPRRRDHTTSPYA